MARVICTDCGVRTGSFQHTVWDADGLGSAPLCDGCVGRHRPEWEAAFAAQRDETSDGSDDSQGGGKWTTRLTRKT